ncbi:MAG: glycoside hydrolase family 127 protein [Lachnospiraceae bacterium]|nr:glycoside hydrolase family 127 protein [Lachnospiraceae bacterium]
MDWSMHNSPLSLRDIQVTDDFWKKEMELVRTEVIPYQWAALNDQVEGAAPSYCMRNFRIAGKLNREKAEKGKAFEAPKYTFRGFEALPEDPAHLEDKFYGFVFQDSDFSKWIEAVGYSLTQHPDPELERIADGAIDIVCAAQQEDGYLDTYYIINGRDQTFSNLRDHHELYCFGHLVEGAVAYYQATGKDKLLKAAERFADFVADSFGPEEGKCKGYPGHEIAEMALVRLYEVTGEQRYLDLSRFFIDQRGTRPYYFDQEHPETVKPGHEDELRHAYNQAHLPVREQEEATGHAVRAVYLYSGMADIARLTQDEALYRACERLWDNIVTKKMYITGGIGGTHIGEAFSFAYDLPNDTAYAETCASIGLVFFARRMLEIRPDSRYADVMERALYNGILSGMALDGKSFFYVNPLEVNPEACQKDERKFHVKPVRQKWFGCACCPPNLARLVSSLASYAYTETEDTLFVHLYVGSEITKNVTISSQNLNTGHPRSKMDDPSCPEKYPETGTNPESTRQTVHISVTSGLPWDGTVRIRINAKGTPFRLALRIPDWALSSLNCEVLSPSGAYSAASRTEEGISIKKEATEKICSLFEITGAEDAELELRDGYLYLTKQWAEEDLLELHFQMEIKLIAADTRVREDIGKAAVTRGPIVYCMEEADNGKDLHLLSLDPDAAPALTDIEVCGEAAKEIRWPGFRQKPDTLPAAPSPSAAVGSPSSQGSAGASLLQNTINRTGSGLYHSWKKPEKEPTDLKFIPYYMWANRSEASLNREADSTSETRSAADHMERGISTAAEGAEMQVWTRVEIN